MASTDPKNRNFEQEYKDLSSLLSNIIESLPLYLFVKDTGDDFKYVYSSPMNNQLYGRFHNDVIGKTDFDLFLDPFTAQQFRERDKEVVVTGNSKRFSEQIVDPRGLLRSVDTIKSLVAREGKDPYLLGMSWDITKQSQIEEELHGINKRLALACQFGGIYPWIWDMTSGMAEITIVENGTIRHMPLMHESFTEKIHPDDRQLYCDITGAFSRGEIEAMKFSFRSCYFTNEYIWYDKIGENYEFDSDGKPFKSIGILRDITSDKRQEEDRQAKLLAEESDRMKSAFIANMSHEIRTPLNAIVGFSTLIAQAETEEEKQEYLKIIESSNEFLLQLIGDILDISKIESGKMEFIYTTFRLNDVFGPQQQAFSLRAQPGVKVIFENDGNNYCIVSEKTRLMQVVTNFLSNAVKFTSSGSICFGYKLIEDGIYCYVTDTGAGIDKEASVTVFDRFVKLDAFKQGTGLGLSICKTIITMLRGQIGVESKVGKGSTFWFSIPCTPLKVGG